MRKTYRDVTAAYMLQLIVKFLNRHDRESEQLWYILTALRGPDVLQSEGVKEKTTAPLRGAIGLTPWSDCLVNQAPVNDEYTLPHGDRHLVGWHFLKHMRNATQVLRDMGITK